ncbi:MAG: carbohydrate kinase family protein [Sulfolobaceae archaeon]
MKPLHLAVGRFNIDIIAKIEKIPSENSAGYSDIIEIFPGGSATNYAVAVNKFGHPVRLLAKVGNNPVVKALMSIIAEMGVNLENIIEVLEEKSNNISLIFLRDEGKISIVRKIRPLLLLTSEEVSKLSGLFDVVHYSSVHPSLIVNNRGTKLTSYDPGPNASEVENIRVDILYVNENEYKLLKDKVDFKIMIIKMGRKGAKLISDKEECEAEAYAVDNVVDTTGAGDVFDAAFNYAYLEGMGIESSLAFANIAAGIKVTRFGGISSPTLQEVVKVLKTNPPKVRCK